MGSRDVRLIVLPKEGQVGLFNWGMGRKIMTILLRL